MPSGWFSRNFDTQAVSLRRRFVEEFCERGWRSGLRACFFIIGSRAGRKEFRFPLFGYRFHTRGNRRKLGIDGLIYAQREHYEPTLMQYFRLERPESTFLDVGANYGYWSRFVLTDSRARGIEKMTIISFEPLPANYELLVKNMMQIPGNQSSVRCEQLAVGSKPGTCFLNLTNSDPGSTFASDSGDVECRVVTIDDYVNHSRLKNVALIKIDVEGLELQVVRGAKETIRRDRPRVICEILPSLLARAGTCPEELFDEMASLGYSHHPISPTDYLFQP
jgi:FkbM family methyltransferase